MTKVKEIMFLGVLMILITLTLSFTFEASAATGWCRVTDFISECFYVSLSSCQAAANSNGGVCIPKN